jgi:hypothetical protein
MIMKEKKREIGMGICVLIIFTLLPITVLGVPEVINYQGYLTDAGGNPLNADVRITFRIWSAEVGGTELWSESHTTVTVREGVFNVMLGTYNFITAGILGGDCYLGMTVGTDSEMVPRMKVTSAAYAIRAGYAESVAIGSVMTSALSDTAVTEAKIAGEAVSNDKLASGSVTGAKVAEGTLTAAHLQDGTALTEILDNDGADSGLDADTLDGLDSLEYARQGHEHDASAIVSGGLNPAFFSAYEDLVSEGHLDNNAGSDLLTLGYAGGQFWTLHGNEGTNPESHFVGTLDEQSLELRVNGERALRLEPRASPNVIGGYMLNLATDGVIGATVSGGGESGSENRVTDSLGTVGGGSNNRAGNDNPDASDAHGATVAGGESNTASGPNSTVGGGYRNTASASVTTVSGGSDNKAEQFGGTVGGGTFNWATGASSTISGGGTNRAIGADATIGGGHFNEAGDTAATVGGGYNNKASAKYATISGGGPSDEGTPGTSNRVTDNYGTISGGGNNQAGDNAGTSSDANFATVGGGHTNIAGAFSATIAGGAVNTASAPWATIGGGNWNKVTDQNGTVAGGTNNQAGDNDGTAEDTNFATVGGGAFNASAASYATIAGGENNRILKSAFNYNPAYATIGGGHANTIEGWGGNSMSWGLASTISGGENNSVGENYATISGGVDNIVNGECSTIGGGSGNEVDGDHFFGTISGGEENRIPGSGLWATIPGGYQNSAGGFGSFAAGMHAKANHSGAFVWSDHQAADFASTKQDEVSFRCLGGARFTSGSGGTNQTIAWAPGSSSWTASSDRNLKEKFVEIDPKEVLAKVISLPVTEWNFKGYSQRHLGPVAQDFHALFPLGGSETMIDTGDLQGVSLAAIQGLHRLVQEKEGRISTLEERNLELEARLAVLETLVQIMAKEKEGGEQ